MSQKMKFVAVCMQDNRSPGFFAFEIDFVEAVVYNSTSWSSFAGETDRIPLLSFLTKCSPENLFNRLPECSWKVLLPWQVVNMVD